MKKIVIAWLCFMSLFFMACSVESTPRRVLLANSALLGEHKLVRIENFSAIHGNFQGLFFLGSGGVSGNVDTDYKLQFWWEPSPGSIIATSLPYQNFLFSIDNNVVDAPLAEFVFDAGWLDSTWKVPRFLMTEKDSWVWDEIENIKINPNKAIKYVAVVKVKISRELLEKEIYLKKKSL